MQERSFEIFICKTKFYPLRDFQLQFKFKKYKSNKTLIYYKAKQNK